MTIQIIYLIALVILALTVMFQAWRVYSLQDKIFSLKADIRATESQRDYFKRQNDLSVSQSTANFGNWKKEKLLNDLLHKENELLSKQNAEYHVIHKDSKWIDHPTFNFNIQDDPNSISSFEYNPKHSKVEKLNEPLADDFFTTDPES